MILPGSDHLTRNLVKVRATDGFLWGHNVEVVLVLDWLAD